MKQVDGFSKLSLNEKIKVLNGHTNGKAASILEQYRLQNTILQKNIEDISENVISNFHLPFSIAPNFLINNRLYHIPMVIEESSVVAAAASAAKFWSTKGGFITKVIGTSKTGQIHFTWNGDKDKLYSRFDSVKFQLIESLKPHTKKMESRGGGISGIELTDHTSQLTDYYKITVQFQTADAMGANFINTCLESMALELQHYFSESSFSSTGQFNIIMAILSNYTPECLVECTVECPISELSSISGTMTTDEFARKFKMAVDIANIDIYRAATHNKGIMNGVDAVVIATGNDFRAIEAGVHAYASSTGQYKSLSTINLNNNKFRYTLTIPLSVGTVGGLTSLHPLAKLTLEILENPSAPELMQIIASAGMANNFSAIKALITSGIQEGHMKMHLNNILNQLNANVLEKESAVQFFQHKPISYSAVNEFVNQYRNHGR